MNRFVGIFLALHGAWSSVSRPLATRANQMQERGFAPGVPHAILVPLVEIAAGAALARRGTSASTAVASAAATALGAVRTRIDLEDQTIAAGTVAAAALSVTGARTAATATRGAARVLLLSVTGAVIVFELTRRRRVRNAS